MDGDSMRGHKPKLTQTDHGDPRFRGRTFKGTETHCGYLGHTANTSEARLRLTKLLALVERERRALPELADQRVAPVLAALEQLERKIRKALLS
jgi:hypothetical protein